MKLISLTAAALVLSVLSVSAEECIEHEGVKYCKPGTVEVVVLGPDGHQLTVNRPPAADAVAFCTAKGGTIKLDVGAVGTGECKKLPDGSYQNCPGACFNTETGEKIDG